MGWCSILLVDNCVHIYSPLPPQCRNELCLHECNVRVCVQCHLILILILKEVWPDDAISSNGTPCSHFLLAKRAMGMFMGLSLSPEAHILIVDVPTQVTVSLITKENKMQQTSVIFNSLTDIFTQFLVLLYCDQFASVISEFCKERAKVIMEDPQNWCSWNSSFLWETACGFSWGFLKAVLQILNILRNYGWPLVLMLTTLAFVGICHTSCLLKFGNQTFTCPSSCCIRKTDFVVDDFYSLLCIITSSWIHIGVKRISQACCLHHLKNMEKNCKTQLWDEKQNRSLFLDLPCKGIRCLNHWHMTIKRTKPTNEFLDSYKQVILTGISGVCEQKQCRCPFSIKSTSAIFLLVPVTFSNYFEIIFQNRIMSTFYWMFDEMGVMVLTIILSSNCHALTLM